MPMNPAPPLNTTTGLLSQTRISSIGRGCSRDAAMASRWRTDRSTSSSVGFARASGWPCAVQYPALTGRLLRLSYKGLDVGGVGPDIALDPALAQVPTILPRCRPGSGSTMYDCHAEGSIRQLDRRCHQLLDVLQPLLVRGSHLPAAGDNESGPLQLDQHHRWGPARKLVVVARLVNSGTRQRSTEILSAAGTLDAEGVELRAWAIRSSSRSEVRRPPSRVMPLPVEAEGGGIAGLPAGRPR